MMLPFPIDPTDEYKANIIQRTEIIVRVPRKEIDPALTYHQILHAVFLLGSGRTVRAVAEEMGVSIRPKSGGW